LSGGPARFTFNLHMMPSRFARLLVLFAALNYR